MEAQPTPRRNKSWARLRMENKLRREVGPDKEALVGEPTPIGPNQDQDKSGEDRDPESVALEGQFMQVDINHEPSKLEERSVRCDWWNDLWAKVEMWGKPPPSKYTFCWWKAGDHHQ